MSGAPFPYDSARRRSVGSERYPGGMFSHGVKLACHEEHGLTLTQHRSILLHLMFPTPPATCHRPLPPQARTLLPFPCLRRDTLLPPRPTSAQESCRPSTRDRVQLCPSLL
jgi:hypothetical protein